MSLGAIPVPTFEDLAPLAPGALIGAVLAVLSMFVRPAAVRVPLMIGAVIAPWQITWMITHGGALPLLEDATSSQRASSALALFGVALALLVRGRSPDESRRGAAHAAWLATGYVTATAGMTWTLLTFLDSEHPHAISIPRVLLFGLVALVPLAAGSAAERTRGAAAAALAVTAAVTTGLGLLLVGFAGAAALSQVVASTSIAASITTGIAFWRARTAAGHAPSVPGIRVLVAGWLGTAAFAGIDAHHTADGTIDAIALALLAAGAILPAAVGVAWPVHGLKRAVLQATAGGLLAAVAVAFAALGENADASDQAGPEDPYAEGALDAYK